MPTYIFSCDKCKNNFEISAMMSDAPSLRPDCPKCETHRNVRRNYQAEHKIVFDGSPKTVGSLADRNTDKTSSDEKAHLHKKHTKYLEDRKYTGPLPEGASVMPRDKEGRRRVSKRQRRTDPKRRHAR